MVPLISRRTILDAFLNVVFYMALGAAAFLSLRRRTIGFLWALWQAFMFLPQYGPAIPTSRDSIADLAGRRRITALSISRPDRTPEITDVVLLLAGAVLLNLAELHNKDSA